MLHKQSGRFSLKWKAGVSKGHHSPSELSWFNLFTPARLAQIQDAVRLYINGVAAQCDITPVSMRQKYQYLWICYSDIKSVFVSNITDLCVTELLHFHTPPVFPRQMKPLLCTLSCSLRMRVLGDVNDSDKSSLWRGILSLSDHLSQISIKRKVLRSRNRN